MYHNNLAPLCNCAKNRGVQLSVQLTRFLIALPPALSKLATAQDDFQHSRLISLLVASLEAAGLCPASRCCHVNVGQVFSLCRPFPSISMPERALLLGHPCQLLCPQEPLRCTLVPNRFIGIYRRGMIDANNDQDLDEKDNCEATDEVTARTGRIRQARRSLRPVPRP